MSDLTHVALARPRLFIGNVGIGPGKIDLLRKIAEVQSISAAGRALDISYRKTWLMISALSEGFGRPVIITNKGGKGGGGASLTPLGQTLIERYDRLERTLHEHAVKELESLALLLDESFPE